MPEKYQNFINARWVDSQTRKTFPSLNPADARDVIGEFAASDVEDVKAAIDAAHHAFPAWRDLSGWARQEILRKAADILESRTAEVAAAMVRENGKTLAEARGETLRGVALLRFYAAEGVRTGGGGVRSVNAKT